MTHGNDLLQCVSLGLIIITCEYSSTSHPMGSVFNLLRNKKGKNNGLHVSCSNLKLKLKLWNCFYCKKCLVADSQNQNKSTFQKLKLNLSRIFYNCNNKHVYSF